MEPSSSERAGLNLPVPQSEQMPAGGRPFEGAPAPPEQAAQPPQTMPPGGASSATPGLPLPPMSSNAGTPTASTNDVVNTTPIGAPVVADDQDLIEKEWVNKAKQIVERTRDDPYQQSKDLTLFKADYMKKRYNKTLKLSE